MDNLGVILIFVVVLGGLVWLAIRAFKGQEVDRRIIFLFILFAVAAPILVPMKFNFKPTPIVQALFDRVESLPAGSRVLLSYDFDPAMAPEVQPMADALTRHCLTKGHKIIYMCLFATGPGQLNVTLEKILAKEFPEAQNGIDYVNLGYKAGNEGVLNVIVTDFKKMFPTDANSVPYDSIEVLNGIKAASDVDLIVSIGGGKPGIKEWVLFVGDKTGVPTAGGVAAVVAPQLYPYYPKQLLGLLGGVKGAAEYESALKAKYPRFKDSTSPAIVMMGPQTVAHIVIISFIIIGNLLFFLSRRKRPGMTL